MLILWFPEMMNRFRWYETVYEGPLNKTSMCEVMSLHKVELKESLVMCNDEIDIDVYINIIIIGIACIPTSLVLPLFVNKLGLRILLRKYFEKRNCSHVSVAGFSEHCANLLVSILH